MGVNPIKVEIINLNLEIFIREIHKFWINKGVPIINLNKIKYSYDEFFIIDVIL